jgi:ClpP class serine protease
MNGPPTVRRTPLFETIHADRYLRQTLIGEIESMTGNALLCIVSVHGQIHRMHTSAVVDLLHNCDNGQPIDLLLNSPGGDIDTAEKLITLVRRRAGKAQVRVIVPDYAKSAATLIALGADEVVMSDTSELGPIDPQVTLTDANGAKTTHSAQSYIDSYEKHAKHLRDEPEDPVARLMLGKLDPVVLEKLRRVTKRSTAIASELLQTAML